jgi:hypothetical protein
MIKTAKRVWGTALSMRPGSLIDKFLDWVEELSGAIVPAQPGASVIGLNVAQRPASSSG